MKSIDGNVMLEQLDDLIDQWHEGDSEKTLSEYLGFTREEYASFIENPHTLPAIMRSRRGKISFPNTFITSAEAKE